MDRGDTRPGPKRDGMDELLVPGFKMLVSLRCEVTVSCVWHRHHTATITGPWRDVLNAVGTFRDVAAAHGRWVVCHYAPSEEVLPADVTDWEPPLCQ